MPPADVLVLGEVHDNPGHHETQADLVREMGARAIVFEMLTPAQALRVRDDIRDDAAALGHALQWEESGWPDFTLYHPIFTAVPDAPVFGGALPSEEVRRAVTDGAAAVMGGAAALFGLDEPLPKKQLAAREALQMAAHCDALPEAMLPGMVEAQRLRDAAMARAVIAAHAETGGPVAVITGNGHARIDWGVPHALSVARPDLKVAALGQLEAEPGEDPPYDLWVVTDGVDRPDPCAVFR